MKEKLKELTKDTAIYGISTILSRFLSFLLVPLYTHYFLPGDYGIISTVFSIVAFLNVIYLYGMDSAYMKYASLQKQKTNKDIFSTPFFIVSITSVLFSVIIISFNLQISSLVEIPVEKSEIIIYTALILFLDSLSVIPFAELRLSRKAKKFAFIRTVNIIANVALNLYFISVKRMGMEAVFISNVIASLITFVLLLPDILNNFHFRIDREILHQTLKFGIPYLPAGVASMIVQVIDRPILQYLTNKDVVGIYQANYKLGIFMMLFVSMFQYAWQPFFLNNAKNENAKVLFSKVLTYFILISSFLFVLLSLFIPDIVKVQVFGRASLIGSKYWSGLYIVPVILLAYIFNGIYYNFTAGIFIEEKTKYIPFVTGAGALINIAANLILIPLWGIMGAAFATLASYVVMAVGLYFVSQYFYKIKYEGIKILKIVISILITAIVYYKIIQEVFIQKIIVLLLFILLLFIFRIITRNEINSLLNIFKFKKVKTVS